MATKAKAVKIVPIEELTGKETSQKIADEFESLFGETKLNRELEGLNDDLDELKANLQKAAKYIQTLRAKVEKLNGSVEL